MWRWFELRLQLYVWLHASRGWDDKRTFLECASRGHPWYGDEHPGAGAPTGRCLCGWERR